MMAGFVPVTEGASDNPLHEAFLSAAEQAGHTEIKTYNAPPHEGASRYFFTIADGERWSAARAFLRPALRRKNLRLLTRAHVCRLVVRKAARPGSSYVFPEGSAPSRRAGWSWPQGPWLRRRS